MTDDTITLTLHKGERLDSMVEVRLHEWRGDPDDAPVGGDSTYLGTWTAMAGVTEPTMEWDEAGNVQTPAYPLYLEIPSTTWSDYHGSAYDRSNQRAIQRDFAEHVVLVESAYSGHGLIVPLGAELPESLIEVIEELHNYPVYDEQDYYELEATLEEEDLDSWLIHDVKREISRLGDADDLDDAGDRFTDDAIRTAWYQARQDEDVEWYTETAVNGYVGRSDTENLAVVLYGHLVEEAREDLESFARSLAPTQPETLPGV